MRYSCAFCFALVVLSLCGDAKGQIVGGTMAEDGTFNFLVKLDLFFAFENAAELIPKPITCAGTIIELDWILTAAHCFYDNELEVRGERVKAKWRRVVVTAGVKNAEDPRRQTQSVDRSDERAWLHPDKNAHVNDVALIKLKEKFVRSPAVGTAVFLKSNLNYDYNRKIREGGGVDCIVQGWGNTLILWNGETKRKEFKFLPQNAREGKIRMHHHRSGLFYHTNGRQAYPNIAPGDSGAPVVCAPAVPVERDGVVRNERQDVHAKGVVYSVLSGGRCYSVDAFDEDCEDESYGVDVRGEVNDFIQEAMWLFEFL